METTQYHYKKIQGTTIAYKVIGKGKPIFCFPGWPVTHDVFLPLTTLLENYSFILIDVPGWAGKSDLEKSGFCRIEYLTRLFEEFVRSFGFKNYALLGYSFGGVFVQSLVQRGLRPRKVILISSLRGGDHLFYHPLVKILLSFYSLICALNLSKTLIQRCIKIVLKVSLFITRLVNNRSEYKKPLEALVSKVHEVNLFNVIEVLYSLKTFVPENSKLKSVSTLVIYSGHDFSFVKKDSREIILETGAQEYIVPKKDHNHIFFYPEMSSPVIKNFLSKR